MKKDRQLSITFCQVFWSLSYIGTSCSLKFTSIWWDDSAVQFSPSLGSRPGVCFFIPQFVLFMFLDLGTYSFLTCASWHFPPSRGWRCQDCRPNISELCPWMKKAQVGVGVLEYMLRRNFESVMRMLRCYWYVAFPFSVLKCVCWDDTDTYTYSVSCFGIIRWKLSRILQQNRGE